MKTPILASITFFFLKNYAVCETLCKNVVPPNSQQMTIWRMRDSYWVTNVRIPTHNNNQYLLIFHVHNVYKNAP
jgi:hypothetical protein